MSLPGTTPARSNPEPERSSPGPEPSSPAERELRALIHRQAGLCVLTGGQTGVDTQAALSALAAGLPVHLVFPRGYRQEDGPITPARRRALRGATLHELASPEFRDRTWTCVYLSDAVVLLDPAGGEGCQETVRAARSLRRPLLRLADPGSRPAPGSVPAAGGAVGLISSFIIRNGAHVLMIAGCRASQLAQSTCEQVAADQSAMVIAAASQSRDSLQPR